MYNIGHNFWGPIMKRSFTVSFLCALFMLTALVRTAAEDLITVSGRNFSNIEIREITKSGIVISHTSGIAKVRFDDLPGDFLKKHQEVQSAVPAKEPQNTRTVSVTPTKKVDLKAYQKQIYEQELRRQLFQKLFKPAPPADPKVKPDIMQNLLFVNGDNGSGTAFKMQFGQQPVIISNAHVFLGLNNPVIRDIRGRSYTIQSIFGAKKRDLVILTYRRKKHESPLLRPIRDLTAKMQANTRVTAYGNSQGSQTHSILPGVLLGIGYDRMEISCGIVGGNSGGPVLLDKTGEVIGVSTYLTIRKVDPQALGTRYAGKSYSRYNIRRFATRIDNLTPDMLEILDSEKLAKERQYYALSLQIMDKFSELFDSKRYHDIKIHLNSYSEDLLKIDEHQWTSSYLKQEYAKKRRFLGKIFRILNEGDILLVTRFQKILSRTSIQIEKQTPTVNVRTCSRCGGSGWVYSKNSSAQQGKAGLPKIRHSSKDTSSAFNTSCSSCSGTGMIRSRNVSTAAPKYHIPETAVIEFRKCILKAEHAFNGFILGGTEKKERKRFQYYSSSKLKSVKKGKLETTYVFKGNHITANAVETRLTFVFNRLLRVELLIPYSDQAASDYLNFLRKNFKDHNDVFEVKLSQYGQRYLILDCRHVAYNPLMELFSQRPAAGRNSPLL